MSDLSKVKAGDIVIRSRRDCLDRPLRVERVNQTQIILRFKNFGGEPYEVRYRVNGGCRCGVIDWNHDSIHIPEDGEVTKCYTEIEREKIAAEISKVNWKQLSLDTLVKVLQLLPVEKPEKTI